ncbi:MAG: hypothetical protein CL878_15795 [Dehalococcoidia bacterium]|nr:hypothetical protein [Dehalococcoidia bacterium]
MKLVRFHEPAQGNSIGVLEGDQVVPLTDWSTTTDLIESAAGRGVAVAELAAEARRASTARARPYSDLDVPPAVDRAHLLSPIAAPEIWACGVTYLRSAEFREGDMETGKGIYDMVYDAARPEIFSKGGDSRCVGPNAAATIRADSAVTVPEAELAYVLGANGEIVGYTICDDVSAWDIERENPLYLPQSKVFYGCTVLGPALVTSDELTDPYGLEVRCVIKQGEKVVFDDSVGTDRIKRSFDELTEYLMLNNPIPVGTVVSTGTGVIVPPELGLHEGDTVEITITGIGTLRHTMAKLARDWAP